VGAKNICHSSVFISVTGTLPLVSIGGVGRDIKYFCPGLWIRIRIRIESGFNDFMDPNWESGSRIQIKGQENEEK
jgi:hypothetical protein